MRQAPARRALRIGLSTAATLAVVIGLAGPASAATQTITYQVQATAAGQTSDFTLDQDVDASAPASVDAGGAMAVTIDPAANTVPGNVSGHSVSDIKDLQLLMPIPANSSYVSATLADGSGLGNGTPEVSRDGDNLVLSVPGPIDGGATFELPTITLNLTAGDSGSIDVTLGGTSLDDPGLTFTADVSVIGIPVAASAAGYPDPNPTLSSTTIG